MTTASQPRRRPTTRRGVLAVDYHTRLPWLK